MLVWDTGLRDSLALRFEFVYGKLHAAYVRLGTPPGEQFSHDQLTHLFEKSRSAQPAAYPQLHCKAAVSRRCMP
eukprot:706279-Alexandrium_andersonii.AAC.1